MGVFLYLQLSCYDALVDDICIPSISFSLVLIAMFHYQVIECRASYNARIFFFFLFGP